MVSKLQTHPNLHSPVWVGSKGCRPQQEGTTLGVFVPIWPVIQLVWDDIGHIGTNTPKFVPSRWGRLPFDPTQTGLCKFGWVWSSLTIGPPYVPSVHLMGALEFSNCRSQSAGFTCIDPWGAYKIQVLAGTGAYLICVCHVSLGALLALPMLTRLCFFRTGLQTLAAFFYAHLLDCSFAYITQRM